MNENDNKSFNKFQNFSGFWLNAPAPLIRDEAHLKLEKKIKLSEVTQQLQFSINGSYLYSLQIRPKPGVTLSKWNLLDYVPEMNNVNGHKGYFVMVTHGLEAPPFNVTMEFNVRQRYAWPLILLIWRKKNFFRPNRLSNPTTMDL